jgi:hypothetical protein
MVAAFLEQEMRVLIVKPRSRIDFRLRSRIDFRLQPRIPYYMIFTSMLAAFLGQEMRVIFLKPRSRIDFWLRSRISNYMTLPSTRAGNERVRF